MALFDKLKEIKDTAVSAANDAAQKAKETYEANKQAQAEKKAAEEAYKAEMTEKANVAANSIIEAVNANYKEDLDGFFNGKNKDEVFSYAKNFFEKILLPANSKDKTMISMYPHITEKHYTQLTKIFGYGFTYDTVLAHIKDTEGQEFLLTYDNFYFKKPLEEDKKFNVVGSVPTSKVSMFSLRNVEDYYIFACDDVEVAKIQIYGGKEADFITLNKFFEDVKNGDFNITNEEIDQTIRKKIGSMTYTELKNDMDDDELLMFFTWNSSDGYVACTTEKIIVADKVSGGNVSNISRYYYDEITKVETKQQASDLTSTSTGDSLGGFLLDMAVSAAADMAIDSLMKNVCDLVISGDGTYKTMPGMVKVEADRIVAIFNTFKKEIRKANKEEKLAAANPQPQVIVQQQSQPDVLEQIQKLAALKDAGILTEEEFNAKKADLLSKL